MMASDPKDPRRLTEPKIVTIHLKRRVLVVLWILVVLPWLFVAILLMDRASSRLQQAVSPASNQPATGDMTISKPGPWGTLECKRIVLEPPDEYVDIHDALPRGIRWFFIGKSRAEVENYLTTIGLSASEIATLNGLWMEAANGTYMQPPTNFVWNLSGDVRSRLYDFLSHSEENERQVATYRYRADKLHEWFADSGLQTDTVQMVQALLYQRGTGLAFADMDLVSPRLPNDTERLRLLSVLSRRAGLQVRLRIKEGTDVQAIAEYWGIGGRDKDVLPILESYARRDGGGNISIYGLLPKFPRTLLNTYPLPTSDPTKLPRNCHWTSLNFFRDEPDDRMATVEGATKEIIENYYEIVGQPRLGDLIVFTDSAGAVIHSCVFIADDIVFTKNGTSMSAPWILMSLADVSAYYTNSRELKIRMYRPKERLG